MPFWSNFFGDKIMLKELTNLINATSGRTHFCHQI